MEKGANQYILKAFGETHVIELTREQYNTGGLAIQMITKSTEYDEPWDILTTNFPGISDPTPNATTAFVDIEKYGAFITEGNIGTPTGNGTRSGFKKYVEFDFSNLFERMGWDKE